MTFSISRAAKAVRQAVRRAFPFQPWAVGRTGPGFVPLSVAEVALLLEDCFYYFLPAGFGLPDPAALPLPAWTAKPTRPPYRLRTAVRPRRGAAGRGPLRNT